MIVLIAFIVWVVAFVRHGQHTRCWCLWTTVFCSSEKQPKEGEITGRVNLSISVLFTRLAFLNAALTMFYVFPPFHTMSTAVCLWPSLCYTVSLYNPFSLWSWLYLTCSHIQSLVSVWVESQWSSCSLFRWHETHFVCVALFRMNAVFPVKPAALQALKQHRESFLTHCCAVWKCGHLVNSLYGLTYPSPIYKYYFMWPPLFLNSILLVFLDGGLFSCVVFHLNGSHLHHSAGFNWNSWLTPLWPGIGAQTGRMTAGLMRPHQYTQTDSNLHIPTGMFT